MVSVTFQPAGKTVPVLPGTPLAEAARHAEVTLPSPCGGKGTCGKCAVKILSGMCRSESLGPLSKADVDAGLVLACITRVGETDLVILVPEDVGREGGKFAEGMDETLVDPGLFPQPADLSPLLSAVSVTVPPPRRGEDSSDAERLTRAAQAVLGPRPVTCSLPALQSIPSALREGNGRIRLGVAQGHILTVGPHPAAGLGIAVDIGTTTVAVQLVALPEGVVLATRSDYNDQVVCGLDVISRINYARSPAHLQELRTRVTGTINRLIRVCADAAGRHADEIACAAMAGNTTMVHLLLGLDPEQIRIDPYVPAALDLPLLAAREVDLIIHPEAPVHLAPGVGSYVGGDITSGLLCTRLPDLKDTVGLFMDIGTNGELVVGNRDFLMGCACSAGPAFEGGGVECGMRAATGAVERVSVDPARGIPRCWTVGNARPLGICGSGMISLLAELQQNGWMDAAGSLDRTRTDGPVRVRGRHADFLLVPEAESGTGKPIYITEADIKNIIRAKAAIYAGCATLLQQLHLEFADLDSVTIAGGFGRFMDIERSIRIGLLPDLPREKFRYVGNTSLTGSFMALLSARHRARQRDLARRMTYVDLGAVPSYMDQYTAALFLPHTDAALFPSVA